MRYDRYAQINEGLRLYQQGAAWDAHEVWEPVWLSAEGDDKHLLQALIQVAAAVHKHQQGVAPGVRKNLDKALANLERIGRSACLGIDVVGLIETIRAHHPGSSHASNASSTPTFVAPALPSSTGPDGFVYLHGFASSPLSKKATIVVPPLRRRGWSVSVPDLNEDDFTHLTISRALRRVRRLLRDRTIIIGSSLGGYLAALLQRDEPRVVATVLMAPAFEFADRIQTRYGEDTVRAWAETGTTEVEHYGYGRQAEIGYGLLEDARHHPGRPALNVPTYILQGRNDDVVPASMVAEVVSAAPAELVTYVEVDDDHALADTADLAGAAAEGFGERFGFRADPV